jgi:EF-hand domain pair
MQSKSSQPMEKTIEVRCQHLLDDMISLTILDLSAYFILFLIVRWIETTVENRYIFLRALFLQFLLSYLLDKLFPKYINLVLSYLYIFACKCILLKSIPRIGFSLVPRNRGKIVFGVSASICLFIPVSFFLKTYVVNNSYLKYLAFFGLLLPYSNINSCPVEPLEDEIEIKDIKLTTDDLKIVIQQLCQFTKEDGDEIDDYMLGYDEFSALFENLEPSLDEVLEAFSIFDQDRDGFFDARDLQIVLINLGLGGDMNLNACQYMIEQHDRAGDGKISSSDFCRLLEISLL